jgi:hypothetical protein
MINLRKGRDMLLFGEFVFYWKKYKTRKRQDQEEKKGGKQGDKWGLLKKPGLCGSGLYKLIFARLLIEVIFDKEKESIVRVSPFVGPAINVPTYELGTIWVIKLPSLSTS